MSESEEERNTPILNIEIIRKNISNFERNLGNLNSDGTGFAFTSLNLENRELEQLCEELTFYKHLRNLNLSSNKLVKIELLKRLPSLLHLHLQHNNILNLDIFQDEEAFPYLQTLDLSFNRIKVLNPVKCPRLVTLNLNYNEIKTLFNFEGHPNLRTLYLKGNKLSSLEGLKALPSLTHLYASENDIKTLANIGDVPSLTYLHLRKNKLVAIIDEEGLANLPELTELNLRENPIDKVESLEGLKIFDKLRHLNLLETPLTSRNLQESRVEVLISFPKLLSLNKEPVTSEDLFAAMNESSSRFLQQEAARRAALKAAREAEQLQDDS